MNDITYHFNETIEFRDYKDFLKRTDLGSQYPEENFKERIKKLLSNRTLSVTARNKDNIVLMMMLHQHIVKAGEIVGAMVHDDGVVINSQPFCTNLRKIVWQLTGNMI